MKKNQSVIFVTRHLHWAYFIRSTIIFIIYKSMSIQSNSINLLANFIHSGRFTFHFIHLIFTVKVNKLLREVIIICKIIILIILFGMVSVFLSQTELSKNEFEISEPNNSCQIPCMENQDFSLLSYVFSFQWFFGVNENVWIFNSFFSLWAEEILSLPKVKCNLN